MVPGQGKRSLVLTPQGRIQGQFVLLRRESDFVVVCDPGSGDEPEKIFAAALLQFKVADRLTLDTMRPELALLSIQGPRAHEALHAAGAESPPPEALQHAQVSLAGTSVLILHHARSTASGFDIILPQSALSGIKELFLARGKTLDLQEAPLETAKQLRIAAGIPEFGSDLSEKILAPEVPLDELVSFTKGCYAGQELVEKASARGRPNRQLMRCRAPGKLEEGSEIFLGSPLGPALGLLGETAGGKACGFITSCCYLSVEDASICLAFIKASVEPSSNLFVKDLALSWTYSPFL